MEIKCLIIPWLNTLSLIEFIAPMAFIASYTTFQCCTKKRPAKLGKDFSFLLGFKLEAVVFEDLPINISTKCFFVLKEANCWLIENSSNSSIPIFSFQLIKNTSVTTNFWMLKKWSIRWSFFGAMKFFTMRHLF